MQMRALLTAAEEGTKAGNLFGGGIVLLLLLGIGALMVRDLFSPGRGKLLDVAVLLAIIVLIWIDIKAMLS